jgi:hypothetical protein
MHVLICLLYGFTVWASLVAYAVITGLNLVLVVVGGPVVISVSVACLVAIDWLFTKLHKRWI